MNAKLVVAASLLVMAGSPEMVAATPEPELACRATVGLRAGVGMNDVIRVTHQGDSPYVEPKVDFQVINAQGRRVGNLLEKPLAENQSISMTAAQIFAGAGLRYFVTAAGESQYLIQIIQHRARAALPESTLAGRREMPLAFQATYKNISNGQLVPVFFTCADVRVF